jgi:hypothetical protein
MRPWPPGSRISRPLSGKATELPARAALVAVPEVVLSAALGQRIQFGVRKLQSRERITKGGNTLCRGDVRAGLRDHSATAT